jgi:hypothetical protein
MTIITIIINALLYYNLKTYLPVLSSIALHVITVEWLRITLSCAQYNSLLLKGDNLLARSFADQKQNASG